MAFEAIILSQDFQACRLLDRWLQELSIVRNIFFSAERALSELRQDRTDLALLDLDNERSSEVLDRIWQSSKAKKPTIVAITRTPARISNTNRN
jgi:DNA-binding response OmpR family regulator